MRNAALIDTGPIVALFNPADRWNKQVQQSLRTTRMILKTTWPVIAESMHLMDYSHRPQDALLAWIERGALQVENLILQDTIYIRQRMRKYADLPMDLADASLMAIAERSEIDHIMSIDSDFAIYRKMNGKYLNNLIPA